MLRDDTVVVADRRELRGLEVEGGEVEPLEEAVCRGGAGVPQLRLSLVLRLVDDRRGQSTKGEKHCELPEASHGWSICETVLAC